MKANSYRTGVDCQRLTRLMTLSPSSGAAAAICAALIMTAEALTLAPCAISEQAQSSISLHAYLRPYARVTPDTFSVSMTPSAGGCAASSQLIDLEWNADARSKQIQIIVSVSNASSAIEKGNGDSLPASFMEARIGNWPWRQFPEPRSHITTAGLLLATIEIEPAAGPSSRRVPIEFRVCDSNFPAGLSYRSNVSIRTILR